MIIVSLSFAIFTLVVLVAYYYSSHSIQNVILLGASYLFLASWDISFALVFAVMTVMNYRLAFEIIKPATHGRWALRIGIIGNLLVLIYFKYSNFFVPGALEALSSLGIQAHPDSLKILLPIGLSFFVVQAISYLLDVSKEVAKPVENPVNFALYMAYFPRVTSGPIERVSNLIPKLEKKRTVDNAQLSQAFELILWGLMRKVVIADLLFLIMPPTVFEFPANYTVIELMLWLLAYSFALYNDFAGYTSIIRGVSKLFGIELSQNFNLPYLSRNFSEFWKRWHITLSDWLRDYVFTPTLRNVLRKGYKRDHLVAVILPPMGTMIASALWHDLSLNMLVWGGLHGTYLVIERFLGLRSPVRRDEAIPGWRKVGAIIIVFFLTILAWIPFRAELPVAIEYWGSLLSPAQWIDMLTHPEIISRHLSRISSLDIMLLIGFSCILDITRLRSGEFALQNRSPLMRAIILNICIFALIVSIMAQGDTPPPFVYQGF